MRDYTQLSEQELTVECWRAFGYTEHKSDVHNLWYILDEDGDIVFGSKSRTQEGSWKKLRPLPDSRLWQMLDELPPYWRSGIYAKALAGKGLPFDSAAFKRALMIAFLRKAMNRVIQEHPKGCGIACVAMLLGLSWSEARALFDSDCIYDHEIRRAMAERGFAVRQLYEPPDLTPFAEAHIICLHGSEINHFVAMDSQGNIYDPLPEPVGQRRILNIMGFYKVTQ